MQTYNFNPVNALKWLVNGQKENLKTVSNFSDKKNPHTPNLDSPKKNVPSRLRCSPFRASQADGMKVWPGLPSDFPDTT
jgi:hypothetical protein